MAFQPFTKKHAKRSKGRAATLDKTATQEELLTLEEEKVYREGTVAIRDLIAPSAFRVESNFIQLGEVFLRTMYVITYPRYISVGWSSPILNLNSTMDVSMFFYPVESAIILKQLKKKVGALQAQLSGDAEKGAPRDPLRETALRDIEQLRDDLTQGIEHFFQFAFYVTIYANDKKELDTLTEDLENIFGARLIYTKNVLFQAEQGFTSTVPLGRDDLLVAFNMNSSPIASSFPFMSSELTSDDGILYGINRHNNSLILFDRFSLQNANMVVFATSGAGKSYAVKLEVLRSLMMGIDVIVIDPEKEYEHLSEAVGGTYINISLASDAKVNPFDLPRPVGDEISTEDIIRSAVITTKGLLRIMFGTVSATEDSLLDRALIESYAKKDITSSSDLAHVEPPIMQDLLDVLEGIEGATELVVRLRKYTEGTFAGLFNAPTNVDVNKNLVIFSVRDLEDELRPMAIYTLINYIWNIVRSERKKRLLIIDEAWWLMQHEDSAKFMFALVKRCRKYYLGVTTITQDVNDFLGSQYGQAIVTNSALQLLLRQSPAAIDMIQKTFLLTEGEKYLLLEGAVGEGIFFAGLKHAAIKVIASYTEDQLITSNPEQLLQIEQAKKEFNQQVVGES
ncbi:MAG: Type IV secretory pathway VirB4 component-like protein [Candidatus Magasanikbacteria bacterium GW2011_GWD2_43_18]|uniref:Type IV secretory pathway VirB4 component-like protein n=1 Tax=Candidatus Magasanikbacteria bacterium GW2011_GWE2_42_7 TaxID=1619052 RepID=A0A0G1BGU5_9BACT|nr:MAG: Type IV secretory pathway VirB4 component-like protein [Candidatus Magasanikbacteria bacterium GW2011_GWC2_42_27]KKS72605.1 MAG: Type IV secretory pathway VirB4 component-like protein [Candidatus Magasanikbacteria bacterium GW2011_GWE2_42_7]KKT05122.1 MAG: Type IV secretory pathway VirB4 component-like protein [Candidatus Magasanikbacteria bacterium GW2011_GWD2_43_18]KKT25787.1 MAG: Type IV secretory pathway VirB4 component-like protein [Candidatus Magasanikbacteria bacterium GW2011_GWA2